jgi:hypothetical protein
MMDEVTILPDGSAFGAMSLPLPQDHWLYQTDSEGFNGPPPMSFRMAEGEAREGMAERMRSAAQWAIRASTSCGKDEDFDPDAMVQNMVVAMLGYHTPDGLSGETWDTPDPLPPLHKWSAA